MLRHAVFVDMLVNFLIMALAWFIGANRDLFILSTPMIHFMIDLLR